MDTQQDTRIDTPKYEHDCYACIFLGSYLYERQVYDLYFCYQQAIFLHPTVIARYGSKDHEYKSSQYIARTLAASGNTTDPLVVALELAIASGLLPD